MENSKIDLLAMLFILMSLIVAIASKTSNVIVAVSLWQSINNWCISWVNTKIKAVTWTISTGFIKPL